jgi:release factor glutamine methyltransferase
MTVSSLLSWAQDILTRANISSPRVDAEWILLHILQCTRPELAFQPTPSHHQIETYRHLIAQRCKRIPLQHLLGETEFYGLRFESTPQALIPRMDTETLVEAVIDRLKHHPAPKILDIGTGSGIIATTLAHELPLSRLWAVDICKSSLDLARRNAHLNHVTNRIHFIQSHLLTALIPTMQFDAIVSNPPYIPTGDILTLEPEVRHHDPHLALDGGVDGLDYYRLIIPQSMPYLKHNGILALEIGHDQAQAITDIISKHKQFGKTITQSDLAGHTRILISQKRA